MTRGIDDAVSAETQILKENRARKKKETALSLKDVEKAIKSLENKIKKQGIIVNDSDSIHLDN